MKPWHLIPQDIRERSAIANCEEDAKGGHSCGGPFDDDRLDNYDECDCMYRRDAFLAAAQVLRDATPYPDEALVFSHAFDSRIFVVAVDWYPGRDAALVETIDPKSDRRAACGAPNLIPLTPGAADFLDAIKAGAR